MGERRMTFLTESIGQVRATDPTGKRRKPLLMGWLSLFVGEEG